MLGEIDMAQAMNMNVGSANLTESFCNVQIQAYHYDDGLDVCALPSTIGAAGLLTPHQRERLLQALSPIKSFTAERLNDLSL